MTEIYIEISKLTDKFRKIGYSITKDENKINEALCSFAEKSSNESFFPLT